MLSSNVLFLNERKQNIGYKKHFEFALGTSIPNTSGFPSNPSNKA